MTIHYLVWVDTEGDIKMVKIAKGAQNPEHLSLDAQNHGWTVLQVMQDIENMEDFVEKQYWDFDEGTYMTRSKRPNKHATWVNKAWTWSNDDLLGEIRQERDLKLFHSDWTVVTDSALTDSQKAEAVAYRAALRDLPQTITISEINSVENTPWPTPPSFLS